MKRILSLVLIFASLLSLTACGRKKAEETTEALTTAPVLTEAPVMTTAATTEAAEFTFGEDEIPQFIWEDGDTATEPQPTEPVFTLPKKFKQLDIPEIVYAKQQVNIRMEPKVNSKSPGTMSKGDSAERVGTSSDGWSALILDEELRYVASKYLTTTAPSVPANGKTGKVAETEAKGTMYANHWVNLRTGPGADTGILGKVPEGAKVTQLAICDNGWIKISYNGQIGYVAGGYLTGTAPAVKPTQPPVKPTEPTTATTEGTTAPTKGEDATTPSKDETTPSTSGPTEAPAPTDAPTEAPTEAPTAAPTEAPTQAPAESSAPTQAPADAGENDKKSE